MAVTVHKTGTTIRGVWYDVGDSFTVQAAVKGSQDSEGSGSAQAFSVGDTAYYRGYATGDGGGLTSYPYMVYVNSSTIRGWFQETIFPYATYTVSYNANGGSGAPGSQTKTYGTTLTLSSTKPTRTGYTFVGWSTSSTATSATYSAGGSYTSNSAVTLYAIWKKTITVTYNANNGSGAPSSQSATIYNATTSYTFTLSSTKPTRTGYKFLGWSTSSTATSATYSSGGSATLSDSQTLYAVWQEYYLTVNYYSNYATGVSADPLNEVGSTKNVLVKTGTFYYDNDYSTYGLANYTSMSNSFYLTRTGYTGTGYWGTTTSGGTLVNQNTGFATGQKLAEAFGKSLESGNASVNIYAQWRENKLTVNYYSNYADFFGASTTPLNEVNAAESVLVYQGTFKYATAYTSTDTSEGLYNYSNANGALYMTRTRYEATGFWCTTPANNVKLEGSKTQVLNYTQDDGTEGIAIGENKTYATGQALAEVLGLSLESGDVSVDLYAHWKLLCSQLNVYLSSGVGAKGLLCVYDSQGNGYYGLMTVYDSEGNAQEVI